MIDRQTGVAKKRKHEVRKPVAEFVNSLNWLTQKPKIGETDEETMRNFDAAVACGAAWGFPIGGIKQSWITGAYRSGMDVKQTELRGSFFLSGAGLHSTNEFAEIITPEPPIMREDMVKVGGIGKSADLRYRGQFNEWEIPLMIRYNKNGKYSLEQILACIQAGGFASGIGEWRPERDGQYGMYVLKV